MDKEKILVTGGAGFIGGHLVDRLIQLGYDVVVLDSLAKPTHGETLQEWFNSWAQFIRGDVREKKDWEEALKGVGVVYHLAGYMDFLPDYSTYFDVNTLSTALMYEVINEKKFPIKKIIVASSQSVYGEGKYECAKCGIIFPPLRNTNDLDKGKWEVECPNCKSTMKYLHELETDMIVPHNPYSISKLALEQTAVFLGNHLSIPSYSFRYTIVHGSRQSVRHFYSGALRQFVSMALAGFPIAMHEDGKQLRDFVHIDDLIDAHILFLKNNSIEPGIFNVGSGKATLVEDLAKCVAKELNVSYDPLLRGEYRIGNARNSVADISKLSQLGYSPIRSIEDNVRDYIAWVNQDAAVRTHLIEGAKKIHLQDPVRNVRR